MIRAYASIETNYLYVHQGLKRDGRNSPEHRSASYKFLQEAKKSSKYNSKFGNYWLGCGVGA